MVAVVGRLHRMKKHTSRAFSFSFSLCRSLDTILSFPPGLLLCSKSLTIFMYSWWNLKKVANLFMWIYLMEYFANDKKNIANTSNLYLVVLLPVVAALYQLEWMRVAGWSPHDSAVFVWFGPAAPGTAAATHSPCPQFRHSSFWADCSNPGGWNVRQKPIEMI